MKMESVLLLVRCSEISPPTHDVQYTDTYTRCTVHRHVHMMYRAVLRHVRTITQTRIHDVQCSEQTRAQDLQYCKQTRTHYVRYTDTYTRCAVHMMYSTQTCTRQCRPSLILWCDRTGQDSTGQRGEERVKEHRNDWEGQEWTGQDRIGW
jgi:hypothetical protein